MATSKQRMWKEIQECVRFLQHKKHIRYNRIQEIIEQNYFVKASWMYDILSMNLDHVLLDPATTSASYYIIMNDKYDDINIHTTD